MNLFVAEIFSYLLIWAVAQAFNNPMMYLVAGAILLVIGYFFRREVKKG